MRRFAYYKVLPSIFTSNDPTSTTMKLQIKRTRTWRFTQLLFVLLFCLSSFSKAKTSIAGGLLLDDRWNLINTSSVYNERIQTVQLTFHGKGFEHLLIQGCNKFAEHSVVSLVGPSDGLLSGLGHLYSQYLSVPYIAVGLQPTNSVSTDI